VSGGGRTAVEWSTEASATAARKRGTPVAERGRVGRLWGGLVDYACIGWWGLVRPKVVEKRPLEIAQAVILRDDAASAAHEGPPQVLLSIRSDLFGWELPGGTVEVDEDPEQALIREVEEETGLAVEIEARVGAWIREGFRPHTAHVYRCRVRGGTPTVSAETPRLAWFAAAEPPRDLFPWYREPLAQALRRAAPETHREWQGLRSILTAIRIDLGIRWRGLP
jgi:8-oxo-dGTP pyrophosphatase MutT (NUDIX family)